MASTSSSSRPGDGGGVLSQFTYRHLHFLRSFSTRSPLRVVAHIDLDSFYAQCEMVRLNTPRDAPLAVQQWESLIAVNYAARPFGITRMITASEAKKRCPELLLPHVATFREGEGDQWAYRDDGDQHISTDKVSLDPYRAESRKIFGVMRGALLAWAEKIDLRSYGEGKGRVRDPEDMIRVEKAGIDEVFVDLSALVFGTLMERFPMLYYGDLEEKGDNANRKLPMPPTTALEWGKDDELVDLDTGETEEDNPDWDDIVMLIGAEIVKSVRNAVWERLKYTCAGGIAQNKIMSKLGSACNKPNKQTIVRNRAIQQFLGGYKFTKMRMLGGKLGKQISSMFGTEEVSDLLRVPLDQLKVKLDDDTGTWLYDLIRGNEYSEVTPGTEIKSMLSTKSFNPGITSTAQAERWMRIFVADIYGRLIQDNILENKRRPKIITIHHRQHRGQTKSRQIPIPGGKAIDKTVLFDLAKTLVHQIANDGNVWPCANLSLNVSGFENGITGNQSLDGFFTRGEKRQKQPYHAPHIPHDGLETEEEPVDTAWNQNKKRKVGEKESPLYRYMRSTPSEKHQPLSNHSHSTERENEAENSTAVDPRIEHSTALSGNVATYTCPACKKNIPELERVEHQDWHFAKDLELQEQRSLCNPSRSRGTGVKRQSRLAFG